MCSGSDSYSDESGDTDETERSDERGDWRVPKHRSIRQERQGQEALRINQQAQRKRIEEEVEEKCRMGAWNWKDQITPRCSIVVRHNGEEAVLDILRE